MQNLPGTHGKSLISPRIWLLTLSADSCPPPNLTRVPLDGKQTQDHPEKGDIGNYRCHSQKGEVVVLADDRTAQLSLPNAERSTDSLSRCVKFDQLATFTFEQMKIKRQEEGGNMEPETGLSVSASVTSHRCG